MFGSANSGSTTSELRLLTPRRNTMARILTSWEFYLMSLPGLLFLLTYRYAPMYGIVIAFKDFNIRHGIGQSQWAGTKYFVELFSLIQFRRAFTNTIVISLLKLFIRFPAPIILAILLNEIKFSPFKRTVQTLSYIPHFLSWVVVSGMFINLLSPSTGIVNLVLQRFGVEPIYFMGSAVWFRWVLVGTDIWKDVGLGAIIYLAAISSINPELYEAAIVDGATRIQRIFHITLPGLRPTIIIILLLRIGNLMEAGHEQIIMMYSPVVYEVADVITTYVYRVGLGRLQYSLTTAAGLFQSVIGCILLFTSNTFAKKIGERGII